MIRSILWVLVAGILLNGCSHSVTYPPTVFDDTVVSKAVTAALLGDDQGLQSVVESAVDQAPKDPLIDNFVSLQVATTMTGESRKEWKRDFRGLKRDGETKSVLRLLEDVSQLQQYKTARGGRQYDNLTAGTSRVGTAIQAALTLQFFPLISLPLDAVDYYFNKRFTLSLSERRELWTARQLDPPTPHAEKSIANKTTKRRATAQLQALLNARQSTREGRYEEALWWYTKEVQIVGRQNVPIREDLLDVREHIRLRGDRLLASRAIVPAENQMLGTEQFRDYDALLKSFVLDSTSEDFESLATDYVAKHPFAPAAPAAQAAIVATAASRNELGYASQLLSIYKKTKDEVWRVRMKALQTESRFGPETALRHAKSILADRKWNYVLSGTPPQIHESHLSGNASRQIQSRWIQTLKNAFIFDVLTRVLTLPLIPSDIFPRDEIYALVGDLPPAWAGTVAEQKLLTSAGRAAAKDKLFSQAARYYSAAGDGERADKMRTRAERRLFRSVKQERDVGRKLYLADRFLRTYPNAMKLDRVREMIEQVTDTAEVITRDSLRTYPNLLTGDGIELHGGLLDGDLRNGELDREGIELIDTDRFAYTDRGTGQRVERPLVEGTSSQIRSKVQAVQRSEQTRAVLNTPPDLPRFPVQVEGGAFPGFDFLPGLIPAIPSARERALYE